MSDTTNTTADTAKTLIETLRDRFAMAALAGLLAGDATYEGRTDDRAATAKDALAFADAMMEARKNE